MRVIKVNASKSYDVFIGQGLLDKTGEYVHCVLPKTRKVMIVSDDNVFSLYGKTVAYSLQNNGIEAFIYVFKHGESGKSLENYGLLLEKMCSAHLTRGDAVIALGGGVTGDLSGFAAATFQRGINFVQIPTSLLAAVDSSVGGKTAVNLSGGKNQVGCFYQPDIVICDTDTLETLPEEEYRNGCAEIIKYALLDGGALFSDIYNLPVGKQYENVISRCVEIKKRLVEEDEHDNGTRMLLNLGHTAGHAVEQCSGFEIPHGRAVAMGLSVIVKAAERKGICESGMSDILEKLLCLYGLEEEIPFSAGTLAAAALSDKKNTSEYMRLVVPEKIGSCKIKTIDKTEFSDWLKAGGIK